MTEISQNALTLLKQRYFLPNENWEGLVKRNVDCIMIGDYEAKKNEMFDLIYNRIFIPNSPSLYNAGKKNQGLFACFTCSPEDDTLEAIFQCITDTALVAKKGGGSGFTGSLIRPKNSLVAGSAHGYAFGPNRFAEIMSYSMDAITQGGLRSMALMYTLSAEHKDIEEFVSLKQGADELSCYNFNQSVMIKDDFFNRAITQRGSKEEHLLNLIAKNAWKNGEPGLLFETTINENTPYKYSNQYILQTNPCSEQALPNYGSCNLGSINLNHEELNKNGHFRYDVLENVVRNAVHYLDAVGSATHFPTEKHKIWYNNNRPIGLGVMGLADLFLRYGIKYGSERGNSFLDSILEMIYSAANDESENLGLELGCPQACIDYGNKTGVYRRNITLLTVAPTGSISIIADCSFGIEPIFSPAYKRIDERGQTYTYIHPKANENYFVSAIGENSPSWKEQIDLVSVCQKHVDSGVSKTINLPNSSSVEDVRQAFVYAHSKGLKGITVYRDGSRNVQVLNALPEETDSSECPTGVCTI